MSGSKVRTYIQRLIDVTLAAVFVAAALPKVFDPESFADAIASYRTVPTWAFEPLAYFLPWFEVLCATLLALGMLRNANRNILIGLLVGYTLLTLAAVVRGLDIHCGCFGGKGTSGWNVIMRNSIILSVFGLLQLLAYRKGRSNDINHGHRKSALSIAPRTMMMTFILLLIIAAISETSAWAAHAASQPTSQPAAENLRPGKTFVRIYKPLRDWRGRLMSYRVNLPPDFRADRKYPIILEWPGRGGGSTTRLFLDTYKLTGHIHVGLTYPLGCRGGTPMLYATKQYVRLIRHVYDDVIKNFNGNPDYVFIGGYSAGGFMAAGPGISLIIRARLRDRLAGVVAGGCNWMCNPKYAKSHNIFLWYADNDSNSYDLPNRLPQLRKYAKTLTVVLHKGAGHHCDNNFEGPAIRNFFALNGPDRKDFVTLYYVENTLANTGGWESIDVCHRIVNKHNTASLRARQVFDKVLAKLEAHIRVLKSSDNPELLADELKVLARYRNISGVNERIECAMYPQ